jgi:hypothetical protein
VSGLTGKKWHSRLCGQGLSYNVLVKTMYSPALAILFWSTMLLPFAAQSERRADNVSKQFTLDHGAVFRGNLQQKRILRTSSWDTLDKGNISAPPR